MRANNNNDSWQKGSNAQLSIRSLAVDEKRPPVAVTGVYFLQCFDIFICHLVTEHKTICTTYHQTFSSQTSEEWHNKSTVKMEVVIIMTIKTNNNWANVSMFMLMPSVLWCCWLGGRKGIRPVKTWVVRCWHGYLSGTKCKWLAYGPADTTATQSSLLQKTQNGLSFWYRPR